MRIKIGKAASFAFALATLVTCPAFAADVKVLLPPPAKAFIQEAARLYKLEKPATQISIEEAASLALLEKARSGFPFDMVVTTGPLMKTLQDEGLAKNPEKIAEGYTVVAFRKGAQPPRVETPADVKALVSRASKISLSDPALGGASSNFFLNIAKDQGVEGDLRQKAVFTPGGHGADPVDRGEAEIGVAQKSELVSLSNVDSVALLPSDSRSRLPLLLAVTAKSEVTEEARNFLHFLKSEAVTKLKEAQGLR